MIDVVGLKTSCYPKENFMPSQNSGTKDEIVCLTLQFLSLFMAMPGGVNIRIKLGKPVKNALP